MVLDTSRVADFTGRVGAIVKGAATLRDLDDGPAVVVGDAHDHVVERLRPDFPADIGFWSLLATAAGHRDREKPVLHVRDSFERARRRSDRAAVELDSDKVQGRADF